MKRKAVLIIEWGNVVGGLLICIAAAHMSHKEFFKLGAAFVLVGVCAILARVEDLFR